MTDRPSCYQVSYHQPALRQTDVEVACWPIGGGTIASCIRDAAGTELTRVLVEPGGR